MNFKMTKKTLTLVLRSTTMTPTTPSLSGANFVATRSREARSPTMPSSSMPRVTWTWQIAACKEDRNPAHGGSSSTCTLKSSKPNKQGYPNRLTTRISNRSWTNPRCINPKFLKTFVVKRINLPSNRVITFAVIVKDTQMLKSRRKEGLLLSSRPNQMSGWNVKRQKLWSFNKYQRTTTLTEPHYKMPSSW